MSTDFENSPLRRINNVIHELGYAYNENAGQTPYDATDAAVRAGTIPDRLAVHDYYGFATMCNQGNGRGFQQSCKPEYYEEFADMFLGWTYGKWYSPAEGKQRAEFMDANMTEWIEIAKNNNR